MINASLFNSASRFTLGLLLVGMTAAPAAAQIIGPHTTYRLEYRTSYYPQEVTAYRVQYENVTTPQVVTRYKQVCETSEQVRRYTVRRQIVETQMQDQQHITYEPHVSYRTQHEDRGGWQAQQVYKPGPVTTRLRWQPATTVVDPLSGTAYYQRGGLVWTPQQHPGVYQTQQVWRPNIVAVQIPQTTYVQKVVTRKVPVQVCRYVDEQREERIPVKSYKMVAVQETIQVQQCVRKLVPIKYTQYVQRVECVKVPIDSCTGLPIATIAPATSAAKEPTPAETPSKPGLSSLDKPGLAPEENPPEPEPDPKS